MIVNRNAKKDFNGSKRALTQLAPSFIMRGLAPCARSNRCGAVAGWCA